MIYGQIILMGICVYVNYGVFVSECEFGQFFSVDVSFDVDMDIVFDDFIQVVNYVMVVQWVFNIFIRELVSFIEILVGKIVDIVFVISLCVYFVQVIVYKLYVFVGVVFDDVVVMY